MADEAKAIATMIANIEKQTGKSVEALTKVVRDSKLAKHGELRTMMMERFGLGHGQANLLVHLARSGPDALGAGAPAGADGGDPLDSLYTGKKADLRPIHDAVLAFITTLGSFETAPKKDYISYRRKKQFLMVGPKTATTVELGLFAKDLPADPRLKVMPPKAMCPFTMRLSAPAELDKAVRAWIKASFEAAG